MGLFVGSAGETTVTHYLCNIFLIIPGRSAIYALITEQPVQEAGILTIKRTAFYFLIKIIQKFFYYKFLKISKLGTSP